MPERGLAWEPYGLLVNLDRSCQKMRIYLLRSTDHFASNVPPSCMWMPSYYEGHPDNGFRCHALLSRSSDSRGLAAELVSEALEEAR